MSEQSQLFGEAVAVRVARTKARLSGVSLSEPLQEPLLRVLSLGMGLQSVTLAIMAATGELPMLDAAIFADTGWEKRATYEYLEYLRGLVPYPIIVVSRAGLNLGDYQIETTRLPKEGRSLIPYYTLANGERGMMPKQCNSDWKKRVVHREIARLIRAKTGAESLPKRPVVEEWLGMTLDELSRLSVSEKRYIHHRYPLVEDGLRFKRAQCIPWLRARGFLVPPKSACIFCPYQGNEEWRDMRDNHSADFIDAIAFDDVTRVPYLGFQGDAFIHRQFVPLRDADLTTAEDHGQQAIGFGCGEGRCGT